MPPNRDAPRSTTASDLGNRLLEILGPVPTSHAPNGLKLEDSMLIDGQLVKGTFSTAYPV